jgi:hypothetical protein
MERDRHSFSRAPSSSCRNCASFLEASVAEMTVLTRDKVLPLTRLLPVGGCLPFSSLCLFGEAYRGTYETGSAK